MRREKKQGSKRRGTKNSPEKNIQEVLGTNNDCFVGTMLITRRGGYVNVDSKALRSEVYVAQRDLKNAESGDKVVVRITRYHRSSKEFEGVVEEVLGKSGDNNTEMHAILAEFGLPYTYPKEVEEAADALSADITPKEIQRRRDMRDRLTFTIDPADAKDFDDAISFQVMEDGNYEVGVHIADVSHYVEPDSIIDHEAYQRATSVYLVDRTIPMLPERLCNLLCSLRPNEDKLCFSVIFQMDKDAKVLKNKICKTVIRSNRRFAYEEAQQIIETGKGDCAEAIITLNQLAQALRKRRLEHGAIDFERVEVGFHLDEAGKPISVYFHEQKEANQLIEELMLLANRTVAETIGKDKGRSGKAKTFVYRIHDVPDPDKLSDLSKFIKRFGYNLKTSDRKETISKGINKLLSDIRGKGEQNLIETLTLRSMAKAIYTTENIGHYGLAFPYYTHFTSPIRRYPDLMVHRLLERYLTGGASVGQDEMETHCEHCSNQEQRAANAERASVRYKQVEFMSEHLGQVFEGAISGVTEWGMYVELDENKCEGLVPIRDIDPNDYFEFAEKEYCLVGTRTGKRFQLGDKVKVKVNKTNLDKKQLDFVLV